MKIFLDGLAACKLTGTDLCSYSKEIITLANSDSRFEDIFVLWDSFPLAFYWERLKNIQYVPLSIDRTTGDYSKLEEFLVDNQIDIYHSPNNGFSIPKKKVCNYISSIHSLYPLANKNGVDEKFYQKFINTLPTAIENSDKIIVNSDFTKDELKKYYSIDEAKIRVVYPKCSEIFKPMEDSLCKNFLKRNYSITDPYILYVGSLTIRKMLDSTINIFREAKTKIKDLKLVLIGDTLGKRDAYVSKLKDLIHSYSLDNDVLFLGTVKSTHLPIFYSKAICLLDFSEYNSYPLSSVEALRCNCITICNRTPVNSTILDKCAIYSNPQDIHYIAEFIHGLYRSDEYREKVLSKLSKPITSTDEDILSIY